MKTFTTLFGLLAAAAVLVNGAPSPVGAEDESNAVGDVEKRIWGYDLVFSGLRGATESPSYMTYKMLSSPYAPDYECTNFCNSVTGCRFANAYTERNAQGTFRKCALFSQHQTSATATNKGQWRDGVLVTISRSNGYNKR